MTGAKAREDIGSRYIRPGIVDRFPDFGAHDLIKSSLFAVKGAQTGTDDFAGGFVGARLEAVVQQSLLFSKGDRDRFAGSHARTLTWVHDIVILEKLESFRDVGLRTDRTINPVMFGHQIRIVIA